MFFKDSIQRKLVSLLNPWLLQELELELKLGFLRSHGVAKNLSFDTSALNRQVFDESSSWSFKEFTVERLSLHVSYWSVPTFIIEVCGVHVTLLLGELKEEKRSRVKRKSTDTALEDRKKVLAEIDPEGSALHDVLQKLSDVNSSRNRKTSLLNVILEHCQLQMHDIHLQVQFPFATESFGILCEIMEFNVGASRTTGCFLKSLIGTIIAPLADVSLTCDVIGVEIGLKKRDDISCLISSVDLFTRMKFKDLHLVDCSLHAPELSFSISPAELAIIFVFYALLGNESNYVRNGRHLWNIAANRISPLISMPRSSLHKLVLMVCLWLRYVNTYVDLLSLLGYPENGAMKISALKMSEDGVFSASVEKQWRLLSEIEKKLPVEAIARARRITRYRAAFRMQCVGKCSNTSLVNDHFNIFRRILVLTDLIWNIICRICNSLVNLLSQGILGKHPQDDGEKVASEDSCAQSCFILSIGLISFAISPLNHTQSLIFGDQISDVESSSLNLLEICVSVGGLLLSCRESISEQCFSISCGQLKINSSSPTKDGPKNINNPKGYLKREVDDLKTTVLRTEPAHMFYFQENCTTADVNETVGSCVSYLQDLLGELWSNWKKSCTGFERSGIPCRENPWILSEIKRSVTDQNLKYLGSGLWKCSLVVGKLHFLLDYSSILSTALVLRQIQYVYFWTQNNGANILLHTPVTSEVPQPITWDDRCKSYFGEVEDKLLKMIPQNYIQIGVFIAGPLIQLSLGEELFHCRFTNESHIARQEDFHLVLDVDNIELAIWPALASDVAPSSELRGLHDAGHTGFPSKEPQTTNISKSDSETFTCQGQVSLSTYLKVNGLKAFFDNSAERKNYQIIVLNPTTITLSLMREDVYSFSTAVIAISATWHGVTAGLAVCLFMDELFVLIKVLFNLYYAMSCAVSGFNLNTGVRFQEMMRREMVFVDFERDTLLVTRTKTVSLTHRKAICVFNGKFEIRSMEMVFHNSRGSNMVENYVVSFGSISAKKLVMHDLPDYGTLVSAKKMALEVSFEEGKLNFFAELFDIQSVIFRDQGENWTISDHFQVSDLINSPSCLCEISLSHCASALRLASVHDASPSGSATDTHSSILSMINDSSSGIAAERSNLQCSSDGTAPGSNYWLVMNITTSEIFMAGFSGKKILVGAEKSNKLESSISVGREFQTIVCHTQGGSLLLETAALALFVECFASYHCCIKNLLHVVPEHMVTGTADNMTVHNGHPSEVNQNRHQQMLWEQLEELTIDLSQISLVLVAADESGGFRELQFEADFHLNLENVNGRFSFDLSRFSILSQTIHEVVEKQTSDIQVPHFSTFMSSNPSSHLVYEDPVVELQCTDRIYPVLDDASCSSHPVSKNNSLVDNSASKVWHFSRQNYILKRLSVSIAIERPVQGEIVRSQPLDVAWIGSGSVTGFDMTISLPEIQMVLSTFDSLSGLSSKRTSDDVEQRHWSGYQESSRSCIEMVPDGALVAIQDVDQHMYMTVDGIEGKYNLVGAIHYSLVGERALFRVKYQNQKRWNSSALWFSLISLYAKSGSGEPLRLNYRQGSGFVDISCSNDDRQAHWRTIACNSEYYEGDTKPESYSLSAWNTFYLVNKKIDQAVAFVDEVPEFVSKPGNPFKWKVFRDFYLVPDIRLLDSHTGEACRTSVQDLHVNNNRASGQTGFLPCINITLDKVILTIVHELPDTKETFPLLQASVSTMEFVVQLLFSKMRVMSRISFALYYFDGETNLWREFINPVEMHIFFRSRFQIQSAEIGSHTVWVHFYARIKEFGISITGLSLDILLFVIGTLNLAGPYAIKVSKILAHCCKVENHSGLDLLCHFYDNQDASVASKQASTIFLRHLALMHQPTEASYVSIQLAQQGAYMTSPINMSLLEAGSLAWRTRIVSIQGSKTYPGPFLVIDTSRKSEEGFSIAVSPLLRIHNETKYSLELRFRRPQNEASEYASVFLKTGDTIDDSVAAFDAINFSGVLKKALMSLSVGNFLFSFRPEIMKDLTKSKGPISVDWSVDLKGGKSVRISGIFDKLSYKVRKAFSVKPVRYSFSTARCSLEFEDGQVADLHFLIQSTSRDIPVILPDNFGFAPGNRDSPVALKEQKEIFVLPTFRIFNLLQAEIHVLLTDTDPCAIVGRENFGNQATIPCGEAADLYANPATIYFIVTLTVSSLSCKPVNSSDCIKKLQKQKSDVRYLDVNLDFGGGKHFASLRLSRGHKGMLEVAIFTSYTLRNESNLPLLCFASNQKPFSRDEAEKLDSVIPPELGPLLPQKSTKSWLMKPNKVRLKLLEEKSSEVLLDLDALSGFAEIGLEAEGISGSKRITKLGLSLGPLTDKVQVSSQIITIVPRYVVFNESEEAIIVRQCNFEDDLEGMIAINSKQKLALRLRGGTMKRETSIFEKFVRKHRNAHDDSSTFIQFRLNEAGLGWSGPVCIASLGRFFVKFRRSSDLSVEQSYHATAYSRSSPEFAAVHVVEENSTLVMHFRKPPDLNLPYRIENNLHQTFITYYQKELLEPEFLGPGSAVDYVWDDLTHPRRLIVQIDGLNLLREINLDKVRGWKPFYRVSQHRGLGSHLPLDKNLEDPKKAGSSKSLGQQMVNFGYEVFADGTTRVLRLSEFHDSFKKDSLFHRSKRVRIRISSIALNLLEHAKQEMDTSEASISTPIVVARIGNVNLDFVLTDMHNYSQMTVQSLSVDQKWVGAPFAAMLRRHQSDSSNTNDNILRIVLVLLSSCSSIKQIKYSSVILQPLDLNLDEETLLKLAPFWRTSLSDSNSQSQQYYFDHFEIQPIKIIASFLPGDSYSSYSSTQETLRTLLHSVIKIPVIESRTVELNGVLVTHALITIRELFVKCAQHYSWYAMRAIYIAKGSPLLPPAFASIFDDLASSSLDAFFDPSSGLISLPGLTIGTFKLISKCIDGKGFSGTKRYLGDLGKTMKTAGSNVMFAAVTEISDSVLKGAEASGLSGVVRGFQQGVLKLAMEPSVLSAAFMEGGPDRKIVLDRSPGIDELYIEGYLQAMLDSIYKQEYLRVRVVDNQVYLKNLPPNSSLIEEIMDRVKGFLVSKALLKGDPSASQPLRHLRGPTEWKIGPTVVTLCEHLFVSFAIRFLRKQASKFISNVKWKIKFKGNDQKAIVPASTTDGQKIKLSWKCGIGKFVFSGILAYIDGRLCRCIPHPVVRRIVSGFVLSFLDKDDNE